MRRVVQIGKVTLIFLVLGVIFYKVWYPASSHEIEKLILENEITTSTNPVALSPIYRNEKNLENIGSINIKSIEDYDGSGDFVTTDGRIIAMRKFLIAHHSPLYPYADVFVNEADKYGLDWRLVASISGVESAFGNLIPPHSNNGWGWKGDRTRPWSLFESWPDGIETVTRRLAIGYGTKLTPFQIEATYCPPCGLNPAHAWANGVNNYMKELERYEKNL